MSEMAQLSGLINAQQAAITTIRGNEKSSLQELNSGNKSDYKEKGDKVIQGFNDANDAREVEDDARKAVIAAEFDAMEVRALTLVNAEEEDIENSLAEAAAVLATENGQLADAVVAARAATAASEAAAKADFGFADMAALEALLGGIFDD
jgi:hypothetical protein